MDMDPVYHGAGYRQNQNEYGRNEYPHPHPQDIHEAIQRGIEKERIREEIIMSEIVRRRVLEAEVRRELMMEREMALQQGRDWFPFGSSPVMGLESPMRPSLLVTKAEGWSAEERLGMALEYKEKLKWCENGGLETLSFQRGTADLRISGIKPAAEGNIEKERILLLTKPDGNVSGSKTKTKTNNVTPPEVVNIELLADVIANKISKEEWSCALCQVMATSEKDLNEHVLGKNHMLKVAAMRAQRTGKNYSIGRFRKKPTKSIHVDEKGVKLKAQSLFSQKGRKVTSKKHVLGKKHILKVAALRAQRTGKNYSIGLFPKKPTKSIHVEEKGVKLKAHSLFSLKGGKATSKKLVLGKKHILKVAALGAQRTGKNYDIGLFPKKPAKSIHVEDKGVKLKAQSLFSLKGGKATSKKHVLGKKHMLKVAALTAQRTGKDCSIGLFPKKPTKSIHVEEKGVKLKAQSLFSQKGGKATSKKYGLPLSQNQKSEHLKKTQAEVVQKVQKNENDPRKKGCEFGEVVNAYKLGNIELPADVIANKKSKEEWRCALCQVIATSEKDLNVHVLGKNHKSKVAKLRAQRRAQRTGENRSNGLFPKKPTKSIHVEEKGVKLKAQSLFSQKGGKVTSKKDGLPLSQNQKSEHLKKTQAEVIQKVQKNENDPWKKGCEFSEVVNAHKLGNTELPADVIANKKSEELRCALCQVIATSEKDLIAHVLGKKHESKVAELIAQRTGENHGNGLFPKKPTKSIHVEEKGGKLKAQSLFSQKVGKATSKKDDLPSSQNPKSEHLKKTQAEVIRNVHKNENDARKKSCKFSEVVNASKLGNIELPADNANKKSKEEWSCALCKVSASSKKNLNEHMRGMKHKLNEAALMSS